MRTLLFSPPVQFYLHLITHCSRSLPKFDHTHGPIYFHSERKTGEKCRAETSDLTTASATGWRHPPESAREAGDSETVCCCVSRARVRVCARACAL